MLVSFQHQKSLTLTNCPQKGREAQDVSVDELKQVGYSSSISDWEKTEKLNEIVQMISWEAPASACTLDL